MGLNHIYMLKSGNAESLALLVVIQYWSLTLAFCSPKSAVKNKSALIYRWNPRIPPVTSSVGNVQVCSEFPCSHLRLFLPGNMAHVLSLHCWRNRWSKLPHATLEIIQSLPVSHDFVKCLSSGDKSVKMNYCCQWCFLWKVRKQTVAHSALRSSVRLCLVCFFPR